MDPRDGIPFFEARQETACTGKEKHDFGSQLETATLLSTISYTR